MRRGLKRHVSEGSTIYTDCFRTYLGLGGAGYNHEAVNHSKGEWDKRVGAVYSSEGIVMEQLKM